MHFTRSLFCPVWSRVGRLIILLPLPPRFSFSLHFASTTLYNWFWIRLPIGIIRRWLFTILGIGFCLGVGARGETPWLSYWKTNIWQRGVHFHKPQNEGTWFCWLLSHSSEFTEIYIWGVSSFSAPLKTILINALVYMGLLMDFFPPTFLLTKNSLIFPWKGIIWGLERQLCG